MDENVAITWDGVDGKVTGTLHKITGFTAFGKGEEASGHYFLVSLDARYSGREITCIGKNTKKANDLHWLLRVDAAPEKKFTFKDGEDVIVTLDFSGANLE